MGRVTNRLQITKLTVADGTVHERTTTDQVSVEEPLEIRVHGENVLVSMRTPGADIDLVHGLLHAEGVIRGADDVLQMRYCEGAVVTGEHGQPENTYNVIDVTLRPEARARSLVVIETMRHASMANSACGVCGKTSIDNLRASANYSLADLRISATTLVSLPDTLRTAQAAFERTGGVHAAALFTTDGELVVAREDVGRHNAVDKVIGWAMRERPLPLGDLVLQVSSRASFELVQKTYLAGIPLLSAVSAPSSLAVDLAREVGMTLAAFVRSPRLNVYAHPERITRD